MFILPAQAQVSRVGLSRRHGMERRPDAAVLLAAALLLADAACPAGELFSCSSAAIFSICSRIRGGGRTATTAPQPGLGRTRTGPIPTAPNPAKSPIGTSARSAAGRIRTIPTSSSAIAQSAMATTAIASTISITTYTFNDTRPPLPRGSCLRSTQTGGVF